MRHRHRIGCQIKSLLYQFGLIECTSKVKTSKKWLGSLLKLKCAPALKYSINTLSYNWLFIEKQMQEIKVELELQAQIDSKIHMCYESFFGVGVVAARILANELEDMSQFPSVKDLYSFSGLTPREYSSGECKRLGHISHQGRPIIRKILVQIAWKTIKKDPQLQAFFDKL
jgi:hypothetical protein